MKSMTGYGTSEWKSELCHISATVQSYNSKNFELRVQVPPFYSALEGELRKEFKKKILRGSIYLSITRSPLWPTQQYTIKWNKKQTLSWQKIYRNMAQALKLKYQANVTHLAKQTGVMEVIALATPLSEKEKKQVKTLVQQAIVLCNKERVREGLAMKKDFTLNLEKLDQCFKKISALSLKQEKSVRKGLKQKIQSLSLTEDQKTVQELIASYIARMDVSEEISRMKEHIKAFHSLLKAPGNLGKKMSFYLQEMIREANTTGAKSQSFLLTKQVIQSKTLIERMREQAQNVE